MRTLLISLLAGLAACTGGADSSDQNIVADASSDPSHEDASPQFDAAPASECEISCGIRAPKEADDGFCPIDLGEDSAGCAAICQELEPSVPAPALHQCIQNDALCFVTIENCIAGQERLANCETWCSERESQHASEGFCEPCLQGSPASGCLQSCVAGLSDGLPAAGVQACIIDDPLCFVDLQGCSA